LIDGVLCSGAVVLVALVLLLEEASVWVPMGCRCGAAVVRVTLVWLHGGTSVW
jgi:hypothetical protein